MFKSEFLSINGFGIKTVFFTLVLVLSPCLAAAEEKAGVLIDKSTDQTPAESTADLALELLVLSDLARGGDIEGLSLVSTITNYKKEKKKKSYTLKIESSNNNSLVTFLKPARSKGIKMLMQGRNMWFISKDVRKPVPISPRQRLLGEASNGDIATTNYSRDYNAELIGEEYVGDQLCYLLVLTAKDKNVVYDKIHYYISKEKKLGLKAEFYTVSGKHFKTAVIEYDNQFHYQDREIAFVSRMEIVDQVNSSKKTVILYDDVKSEIIPHTRFNLRTLL